MVTVLYVDDDPLLLDAGRQYIQKISDFTVDIAESAADALTRLGHLPYDAVISDYQMPSMDGLMFLKHLRENQNNIPFILFTGKGREEVAIEALNNGADYYLQKGGQPKAQFTELVHKVKLAVEKRQAEKQLRRSHQQIKDIINHLPDPTFAIDMKGKVIAWNNAQISLTGLSGDDMIGKGDHAYSVALYGEKRPMLLDAIIRPDVFIDSFYQEILRDGDTITAETSWIQAKSKSRILWGKASPLYDENGAIIGAIETVRDITERKRIETEIKQKNEELAVAYEELSSSYEEITASMEELRLQKELTDQSENQFKNLIEQIPDGIIILHNFVIRFANQAASDMLRYNPEKGLTGENITRFIHPRSSDRISFQISECERISGSSSQEWLLRSDGIEIPVEVTTVPYSGQDEESVLLIFRDFSDQKRAIDAMKQTHKKMQLLTRITRHDIGNQVGSLATALEALTPDMDETEFRAVQENMKTDISMIEADIEFSKDYEQIGGSIPGWFRLRELFAEGFYGHELRNISWTYTSPDEEIYADPLINKVFPNLIDNSIRHGETVSNIFIHVVNDSNTLRIIYEDNGCGIPAAEKEHIFQMGYGKHTGFGLFLIREILSITGITINETGIPGKGVRFEITVPSGKYKICN